MENSTLNERNLNGYENEILKKYGSHLTEEIGGMISHPSIFVWVDQLLHRPQLLIAEHTPKKVIILRRMIEYDYENFPEFCFGLLEIKLMKRFLLEMQIKEKHFYIIGYRKIKTVHSTTKKTINQIEIYYLAFYQTIVNFFAVDSNNPISTQSINVLFDSISKYLDECISGNYYQNTNSKYGTFSLTTLEGETKVVCDLEYIREEIKNIFYNTFKHICSSLAKDSHDKIEEENREMAWLTVCLGKCLFLVGDFENSLNEFSKAFSLRSLLLGEIHPEIADSLEKIGNIKMVMRKYEESLELFKQSYEIRIKCLHEDDTRISDSLYNIATVYFKLKNLAMSRDYFEKTQNLLQKIKKKGGIVSIIELKIANSLEGLGLTYSENGEWKKVLDYYLLSLNIYNSYFDEEHSKIAFLNKIVSGLFKNLKEEVKSFEHGLRAYQCFLILYGKNQETKEALKFLTDLKSYRKILKVVLILCVVKKNTKKIFKRKLIVEDILMKFI